MWSFQFFYGFRMLDGRVDRSNVFIGKALIIFSHMEIFIHPNTRRLISSRDFPFGSIQWLYRYISYSTGINQKNLAHLFELRTNELCCKNKPNLKSRGPHVGCVQLPSSNTQIYYSATTALYIIHDDCLP